MQILLLMTGGGDGSECGFWGCVPLGNKTIHSGPCLIALFSAVFHQVSHTPIPILYYAPAGPNVYQGNGDDPTSISAKAWQSKFTPGFRCVVGPFEPLLYTEMIAYRLCGLFVYNER